MDRRRGSRNVRVSPKTASGLSEHRRAELASQIEQGLIKEGSTYTASKLSKKPQSPAPVGAAFEGPEYSRGNWSEAVGPTVSNGNYRHGAHIYRGSESAIGAVAHSEEFLRTGGGLRKEASSALGLSSGTGSLTSSGGAAGPGGTDRLAPEVYSPLFMMANLNLPRDRITVNAWIRNFYDLHPIVRNAITLHATYPISKLNLKCHDKKVLQFFEDMVEDMNLMEGLGMLALEFWKLGEVFPFLELDDNSGKWNKMIIHNPDYIHVKKTVLAGEPLISMKADAVLQRLVMSNNPADVQIRKQIPENIQFYVRKGQPIPLDNFNVSHLKMLAAPYDVRGTSVVVSVFKDLMLYDKLRECYSDDTEFLTKEGFKTYDQITDTDLLATFNKGTEELEYQKYTDRVDYDYEGDMYHFFGKKIDMLVTPGHRMWASHYTSRTGYKPYNFIEAKDFKMGAKYRMRSVAKYEGKCVDKINVLGEAIDAEKFMKLLGYMISEGSTHIKNNQYCTSICQDINSPVAKKIKNAFKTLCNVFNQHVSLGVDYNKGSEVHHWRAYSKKITKYFAKEIGQGSHSKKIPRWVMGLDTNLLKILVSSMVEGDGSVLTGHWRGKTKGGTYSTASKQLASDLQEILFKCGYASRCVYTKNGQGNPYYFISWSFDTNNGKYPYIMGNAKKNKKRGASIDKIPYKGKVVCFTVPNELLIVRRNGLISIQGNCKFAQADSMVNPLTIVKVGGNTDGDYRATQEDLDFFKQMLEEAQYDKDFKLITHAGVDISRIGASGAVIDVGSDFEMIMKNIYTGLMVPPSVVDSDASSYNSASIGLEVLRQRYFNFRNMLATWLQNKVFAPIAELHRFTEYKDGSRKLIIPEVEWNQMNLYDLQDYIGNITGLLAQKQVSLQTVYKSLGLSYEDEIVKRRQETIDEVIALKEQEAISMMSLTELRGLDPEKPISEPVDSRERPKGPTAGGGEAGAGGAMDMGIDLGGGGGGGMDMGGELGGGMPELAPPPTGESAPMGGGGEPGGGGAPPMGPGV